MEYGLRCFSRTAQRAVIPGILVLLGLLASTPVSTAQAQNTGLFTAVDPALAERFADADETVGAPGIRVVRRRIVRIDLNRLAVARASALASGAEAGGNAAAADAAMLTLTLFDDLELSGVVEHARQTATGTGYALSGQLRRTGNDGNDDEPTVWEMTLLVYDDVVAGTIRTPEEVYEVRSVGNGVHAITQVESVLPPDDEPILPSSPSADTDSGALDADPPIVAADDGSSIDVAVFYTPAARRGAPRLSSAANIVQLVDKLFFDANSAYRDSGVNLRMNLVRLQEVAYSETTDTRTNLERLNNRGDNYMDEVHAVRDAHGADLVHLIVDLTQGQGGYVPSCGRAQISNQTVQGAFGITHYSCTANYTFAHELGHNLGLHHDRYQTLRYEDRARGVYDYSHGYVNQRAFPIGAATSRRWRTIMSYDRQCLDAGFEVIRGIGYRCSPLRRFSNPDQTYRGDPVGVRFDHPSTDIDGAADARRTLNRMRTVVANFRQSRVGGGGGCTLEDLGTVTGTVTRNGTLGHDCVSPNWTGELARFYSFMLERAGDVRIDMTSSAVDAWLALRQGADVSGAVLVSDNDGGAGTDARITTGLSAGTYTIEATTAVPGVAATGAFTLAVAVAGTGPGATTDRAVLETLYHAAGGPGWIDGTNWLSAAPLSTWFGVTTNDAGRVTSLQLPGNALSGSLPPALGNLAFLEDLHLGSRYDSSLGRTFYNELSGPIPPELAQLSNLRVLRLYRNSLSGPLPAVLAGLADLEVLSLGGNRLSGSIPPELSRLAKLDALYLWGNDLSGPIPLELARLSNLRWLELSTNRLNGPVPPALAGLANLEVLYLGRNRLSGPIPAELGRLANLRYLSLGSNQLVGPIPAALGNLANLESLSLSANSLSGPIPVEVARLANLEWLDLEQNLLSGPIPAVLANLANLEMLWLSGNDFSGPIPAELAQLASLRGLYLSSNQLSGPVPGALGNLANIEVLDIESNYLSGPIPEELEGLARLERLELAFNEQLAGPLPPGLQRLPRLEVATLSGTDVCVPADAAFQDWTRTIDFFGSSGRVCGAPVPVETVIDVAVFYTPAARLAEGGTAAIAAAIDLMIAETNQAYAESGVLQRVVLVAREEVQYTEYHPFGFGSWRDLDRLANPSDGYMDEVHALRDRVGADLVHLIADRDHRDRGGEWDVCGIAYLPFGSDYGAFGLTHHSCGGRTFAHELGHNMGLQHDRFVQGAPNWPFPYGHGYANQRAFVPGAPESARWITIMSYQDQCSSADVSCQELLRFSNPRQTWRGDSLGVAGNQHSRSVGGPADAVRALNRMRHSIAALRTRAGDAGNSTGWRPDTWRAPAEGSTPASTAAVAGEPGTADAAFTHQPVRPGTTPVRAIHFDELRARIALLRARAGLPAAQWTDPILRPGITPVRRVHLTELRAALDAVYDVVGRPRPRYTDAAVTPGVTGIKAAHLTELRTAVAALDP